ncbi:hypothetical protein CDAR_309491 [Caerostris darwini]|uniref:LAGLIDADG homing endonuclease n=1 Tax=Caerostris darwini TaxID=1538125 RepID=A0AAV4SP15_9ARAC|nr:hypothetical protein CDAR_309491 [Caerostris darwini]
MKNLNRESYYNLINLINRESLNLRTLKISGVTTANCALILILGFEPCFQEEFLKSWKSSFGASTDTKERLTNLKTLFNSEPTEEEKNKFVHG